VIRASSSVAKTKNQAKFRIAWIRQLAPNELRAGIECLEPQNKFWGLDLSNREDDVAKHTNAVMTLLARSSD
jgi:hypothetical protein